MTVKVMTDKFVAIFLGAILLPTAFYQWFAANTTGWDATAKIVWPVVGILAIVSIAYGFIPRGGGR